MYFQWLLLLIQLLAGCRCCFYLSPCIVLHRYLSTCITAKLSNSPSIKLFSCVANIASENAFSLSMFFNKHYRKYVCCNFIQTHFKNNVQQTFLFCSTSYNSENWILRMCYTYRVFPSNLTNCDLLAKGQKHHWLLLAWLCNPGYKAMAIA